MPTKLPTPDLKPMEGHYGNLNGPQMAALTRMWEELFNMLENPDVHTRNANISQSQPDATASVAENGPPSKTLSDSDKASKEHQEEQAALADVLVKYGVDKFRDSFWYLCGPDPPDMIMLKFLRARNWDVDRGIAMLARCIKWRIESDIVGVITKGDQGLSEEDPAYLKQGESGKVYAASMTDQHMPIIFIEVRKHLTKDQSGETMRNFIIMCTECFRSLISYPNDKIVIVFDLAGFGLKNMDWGALISIIQVLQNYYPETLFKLYIHNAPWIFQGLWKIISGMLDPAVRSKVGFTGKVKDFDLIPIERVPERMGGTLVEPYSWIPPAKEKETSVPADNAERVKYWNKYMEYASQFEAFTKEWIASGGTDENALHNRDYMTIFMRKIYFDMVPFSRGTTYYMRAGIVQNNGCISYRYKQKDGKVLEHDANVAFSIPKLERIYPEVKSAHEISPKDVASQNPGDVLKNLTTGQRPQRTKSSNVVSDVAQPREGQLGARQNSAAAAGPSAPAATPAAAAAGAGVGAVGAGVAATAAEGRGNASGPAATSSSYYQPEWTPTGMAGGGSNWNSGPTWANYNADPAMSQYSGFGYAQSGPEQFRTAPTAPRMSNDSDIPGMRNGGRSVYTTNAAAESTEDIFHDADGSGAAAGVGMGANGAAAGTAAGAPSRSRSSGAASQNESGEASGDANHRDISQETEEGDFGNQEDDEPQAVSAFEAEHLDRTAHESHSKNALGIPGTAEVQGESDSPLAGFPNLSGQKGAAPIAKANEQFKKEAEVTATAKKSFLSRLNCCGGKGKVE